MPDSTPHTHTHAHTHTYTNTHKHTHTHTHTYTNTHTTPHTTSVCKYCYNNNAIFAGFYVHPASNLTSLPHLTSYQYS